MTESSMKFVTPGNSLTETDYVIFSLRQILFNVNYSRRSLLLRQLVLKYRHVNAFSLRIK